jgi:hypothetical protein
LSFSKTKDRKVKRSCLGVGTIVGRGREGKGGGGEYGGNMMYSCMKMGK